MLGLLTMYLDAKKQETAERVARHLAHPKPRDVSIDAIHACARLFWAAFDEEGATAVAAAWKLEMEEGRCPATSQTPTRCSL